MVCDELAKNKYVFRVLSEIDRKWNLKCEPLWVCYYECVIMKVLQITGSLYPYSYGGIGIVVDQLSDNLTKAGMDVEVLFLHSTNGEKYVKSYPVITFSRIITIYGNPISFSMLPLLIRKRYKYDVIHAHSHLFYSTLVCALLRRIGSSPLVITNHGLYSQTAPRRFSEFWLNTFGVLIYKAADKIICLTKGDKSELVKLGVDDSKITIIPNWIDTTKFRPNPDREIKNRLLYVGRLVPGKGVQVLVDSFRDIIKDIPSARLVIIGSGPDEAKLKQMANDYSLNDVIEFKKHLNDEALLEEYQKCSIFVLPSFSEGLPLTILEAMACKKPVIATADIHDLVGNAGIVVSYDSPSELRSAILSLLLDEDKMKGCVEECSKSMEKYTWKNVENQIVEIYKDLVK